VVTDRGRCWSSTRRGGWPTASPRTSTARRSRPRGFEPQADGVRLLLVHDRLGGPEDVEGWRRGWTPILTNLQALLEGRVPDAAAPASG